MDRAKLKEQQMTDEEVREKLRHNSEKLLRHVLGLENNNYGQLIGTEDRCDGCGNNI
jgi:RNA polymerase-binding transcription factor DksA